MKLLWPNKKLKFLVLVFLFLFILQSSFSQATNLKELIDSNKSAVGNPFIDAPEQDMKTYSFNPSDSKYEYILNPTIHSDTNLGYYNQPFQHKIKRAFIRVEEHKKLASYCLIVAVLIMIMFSFSKIKNV